jgi:nitric oxide dioxygenase
MLSAQNRPVIEATLPVIGAHIARITPLFYGKMFEAHPELLNGTFSRANQRNGSQPEALAGSIARFASWLLEHPDSLPEELLARIAHKHASLDVRPEQYQIVHDHLFAAIVEVLGDAVTPEVAAAWDEVYWLMANALIGLETGLYQSLPADAGYTPWRVASLHDDTESVRTFELVPASDAPAAPGKPGQYVSVRLETADGLLQPRQFSLSCDPASTEHRIITVKRDDTGEISPVMHSRLTVGDVIDVSPPFGLCALPDDDGRPLALVTAGIGITSASGVLCALKHADDTRRVTFIHANRTLEAIARREQVHSAAAMLPNASVHWFLRGEAPETELGSSEALHLDEKISLAGLGVTPDAHVFLCGPFAFMKAMREQALELGVAAEDIHYDAFGPDLWMVEPGRSVTV